MLRMLSMKIKMMGKMMQTRPSSSSSRPSGTWIRTLPPQPYLSFRSESQNFISLDEALSSFNGMLHSILLPPSLISINF